MKLHRLELEGFGSYRQRSVLDLLPLTACVVTGDNGSGKTTLFDAVLWAMFGETIRPSASEVINWQSDKAEVILHFTDQSGETWEITRRRTTKGNQTVVAQSSSGATYSKAKEVAARMATALGGDAAVLATTAFARAGEMGRFARGTSSDRRTLLARALPDLSFKDLEDKFKRDFYSAQNTQGGTSASLEHSVEIADTLADCQTNLATATQQAEGAKQNLDGLREMIAPDLEVVRQKAQQARTNANRLAACENEIIAAQNEAAELNSQIQTIAATQASLEASAAAARDVSAQSHLAKDQAAANFAAANAQAAEAPERLKRLGTPQEDQTCWMCGQALTEAHVAQLTGHLHQLVAAQTTAQQVLTQARTQAATADQALQQEQNVLNSANAQQQKNSDRLIELTHSTKALTTERDQLIPLAADVDALEAAAAAADTGGVSANQINEAEHLWKTLTEKVGEARQQVADAEAAQQSLPALRQAHEANVWNTKISELLVRAFQPRGVPQIFMERIAVRIAAAANRMLAVLSDFQVKFATHQDDSAPLALLARRPNTEWKEYESYSTGQQTRIDIALRLGLIQVLNVRCGVLLLDEGWGALDNEGIRTLGRELHTLIDQNIISQFFTITHTPAVAALFQQRILVEHDGLDSVARIEVG